ncbi:MAG: hypothetical protein FWG90_06710 [Oscillospiraceae bacterium]|nr:hypothetical protein [Oscillospiraceae bacterium]
MSEISRSVAQGKSTSQGAKRVGNPVLIGCIFLGICILISGLNIGASISKLNKTVGEADFSPSNVFRVPSTFAVGDKKYFNEREAAAYLNISDAKMLELIESGQISEYVKTDTGYSVSVDKLDEWFDNEAYQNMLRTRGLTEDS